MLRFSLALESQAQLPPARWLLLSQSAVSAARCWGSHHILPPGCWRVTSTGLGLRALLTRLQRASALTRAAAPRASLADLHLQTLEAGWVVTLPLGKEAAADGMCATARRYPCSRASAHSQSLTMMKTMVVGLLFSTIAAVWTEALLWLQTGMIAMSTSKGASAQRISAL